MTKKEKLLQRADSDGTKTGPSTTPGDIGRKADCFNHASALTSVSHGVGSVSVESPIHGNAKTNKTEPSRNDDRKGSPIPSKQRGGRRSSSIDDSVVIPLSRRIYEPNPNDGKPWTSWFRPEQLIVFHCQF